MQPLNARNLSQIREEYDRISKTSSRFSFIRATIFAIAAFALASGLTKISSSNPSETVERLKRDTQITQKSPIFDDAFLSAIYGKSLQVNPSPAPDSNAQQQEMPALSEEEKKKAQDDQDELVAKLKEEAQKAFDLSFTAPLLGTKIDVDLRFWGFVLPVLAILSETYLAILRYKKRLVFKIGSLLVRRDSDNASSWDRIQFSERNNRLPPFMRHPDQYQAAISWIGAVALTCYVATSGKLFWDSWDMGSKLFFIEFYLFIAVYAVAYTAYTKRQLRSQVLPLQGLRRPQSFAEGLGHPFVRWLLDLLKQVPAKINLVTGSLLAICTLWLFVAKGCDSRATGIKYLESAPSGWLSGPLDVADFLSSTGSLHPRVIWTFYLAGLLLALLSLIIVLRFQRIPSYRKLASILRDLSVIVCMFFVTDLCFGDLLEWSLSTAGPRTWIDLAASLPTLLIWMVPIAAWIRYRHTRFRLKRRSLIRWYHPQIAFAAVFCLFTLSTENKPRVGVPVFVAGVGLIAAAYAMLARPRNLLTEG